MRQHVPAPPLREITVGHFSLHKAYTCYREEGTNDWQLLFHHEGRGIFHHKDGDVEVRAGDVYLLPPRVAHNYGLPDEGGHWSSYWAHFLPRSNWLPLLQWRQVHPGLLHSSIPDPAVRDKLIDLFRECISIARENLPLAKELAMTRLEEILIRISRAHSPEGAGLDPRITGAVQ